MSTHLQRANDLLDSYGMNAPAKAKEYLLPLVERLLAERISAKVGDTIIYGNDTRSKIINILKVNGVLSYHMDVGQYDSMATRFREVADMNTWLAMGIFKLEKANAYVDPDTPLN